MKNYWINIIMNTIYVYDYQIIITKFYYNNYDICIITTISMLNDYWK